MQQPVTGFNSHLRQLIILLVLLALIYLSILELHTFFPGLLGAITLYIISRGTYFQLVYHRKWGPRWTAFFFLIFYFLILAALAYITIALLEKQAAPLFNNPSAMLQKATDAISKAQDKAGVVLISSDTISELERKISVTIPMLVNSSVNLFINLVLLLFLLYYMLVHSKEMENFLQQILPLKKTNINLLASETKILVKASALGIPLISLIQGATATLGYLIFGVKDVALWGFLTGMFAFFPIIGTMAIWVPLVLIMFVSGNTVNATGLFFYSLVVTGNIDYVARITIMKKWGQIHPTVTVLGIIVGLGLFGFIGLIFGPLLVNYIILIFKIYLNEFVTQPIPATQKKLPDS